MKKLILLMMLLFSCMVNAQDSITVPKDYTLETNADYHKYEQKVIECVDWLLANPIDKYKEQRIEINAFLIAWMAGSPDVSIELTQEVVTFTEQADALIMFMAGWTKHAIQTKDYNNLLQLNLHGVKAVISLYKKNKKQMGESIPIEKYIEMEENGILKARINSLLNG